MSEERQGAWLRIDLHVHAGSDRGREGAILETLRGAAEAGLDIVGLVDHNSVRSYEQLRLETGRLAGLKAAGRLVPDDDAVLAEYERLLERLLLLPGFEVTTSEGIALLALFPPEIPAERLYALLLTLGIPMERLREGSPEPQVQADLALAAALVAQAGGIAVAVNAGAGHGPALGAEAALPAAVAALEVTLLPDDLPPTALPLLWCSAAGCRGQAGEVQPCTLGERYTEALLPERSFDTLRALLLERQGERMRFPERERLRAYIEQLRQEGPDRVILCDAQTDPHCVYRGIAALANSGGGIMMIGLTEHEVYGVDAPEVWSSALTRSVREQVEPMPRLNLELLRYSDKEIIKVEVQAEAAPPYMTREGVVYLRRDGEIRPATRQELLDLAAAALPNGAAPGGGFDLPQAGVEVVGAYLRDGVWFYDVRDLRVTSGVTRQRAKGLWAYAIERQEALRQGRVDLSRVLWRGDRGIWQAYRSGERRVFDLMHRDPSGRIDHIFYGVSEWGLTPRWREVVEALRPPLEEGGLPLGGEEPANGGRESRPAALRGTRNVVPAPVPHEPARPEVAAPQPAVAEPVPAQVPAAEPVVAAEPAEAAVAAPDPAPEPSQQDWLIRPTADSWGGRLSRWRDQAAVEHVYWEGSNLFFDLAMRQDGQLRHFRHITRNQLAGAEGWADLVRVPLPPSGVEVVRSTASGEEVLYQFRDMQNGRVDPRVRRKAEFPAGSPWAYAIEMYHHDSPLKEEQARWWGNVGYLRIDPQRVDLVYRDEEGRDHIYYAAERALLTGEWQELLRVWNETARPAAEQAAVEQGPVTA